MSGGANGFGAVEIKAFVPAKDFALSKRFYEELGFEIPWSDDTLAYMRLGDTAFFLQNFYVAEHAGNFMMHLIVKDVDGWWARLQQAGLTLPAHAPPRTMASLASAQWGSDAAAIAAWLLRLERQRYASRAAHASPAQQLSELRREFKSLTWPRSGRPQDP